MREPLCVRNLEMKPAGPTCCRYPRPTFHPQPISKMKTKLSLLILSSALVLAAGCSTVDSRIAKNRSTFNTWPADVQEAVAAGKIGVGFTPDQVQVALGAPDWTWSSTSADGTSQVWSYRDHGPRFGFGFGVGSF